MKKYSYVIRNPWTKVVKGYTTNHDYYRIGDKIYLNGEEWIILSMNFKEGI